MPFTPVISEHPDAAEVRTHLHTAADELVGLQRTPAEERSADHSAEVRARVDFIHEFDPILTGLTASVPPPARGPEAAFDQVTPDRPLTAGEMFTRAPVYEEVRGRWNASYGETELNCSIAQMGEARALLAGGATTVTWGDDGGVWRPMGSPIPPPARQMRMFIRDVLNVIPTTLSAIPYIRELNPATNETGATAVAEGSAKPEVTLEFEADIAPVVKIAAWVPVTSEIVEDAPMLEGYINTRLTYMVKLREEFQILNGPGTGPNMKGIRQFTVQTQTAINDDVPAGVGLSIGKIENVDGEADFVAMNPTDYWKAVVERHSTQFDNGYGGNAPAVLSAITWGLPAIRTRAMEATKGLVGSRMGATIADRASTVIRVGNQHSTYFTENKVVILAEERIALLVHRADLFCEFTVTFT